MFFFESIGPRMAKTEVQRYCCQKTDTLIARAPAPIGLPMCVIWGAAVSCVLVIRTSNVYALGRLSLMRFGNSDSQCVCSGASMARVARDKPSFASPRRHISSPPLKGVTLPGSSRVPERSPSPTRSSHRTSLSEIASSVPRRGACRSPCLQRVKVAQ